MVVGNPLLDKSVWDVGCRIAGIFGAIASTPQYFSDGTHIRFSSKRSASSPTAAECPFPCPFVPRSHRSYSIPL